MKKTFVEALKSLLSRKFLLAVVMSAASIAVALGADNEVVQAIAAALSAVIAAVYIIVEGKLDAESIRQLSESVVDVIEAIDEAKDEPNP
jgi:tape measure domain-containing protein